MLAAAESLEFERAAGLRDRIMKMRDNVGKPVDEAARREGAYAKGGRKGRGRGGKSGGRIPRPKKP